MVPFKKCAICEEYHLENEECRPVFTITLCDTEITTKVYGLSHWHAARGYAIKTWFHITTTNELFLQPNMMVDVTDKNGKTERYVLSVEFCAHKIISA